MLTCILFVLQKLMKQNDDNIKWTRVLVTDLAAHTEASNVVELTKLEKRKEFLDKNPCAHKESDFPPLVCT